MIDKTTNNVNFYKEVTDVQIQQGNNNKLFVNQTDVNEEKVQLFLNQLQEYKMQFQSEFGNKSDILIKALDDAQIALDTKDPTRLGKATSAMKDIAMGAAGSLLATGILSGLTALNL